MKRKNKNMITIIVIVEEKLMQYLPKRLKIAILYIRKNRDE